ncbi:unnamed protein product, partial [marine sediment metagenome]
TALTERLVRYTYDTDTLVNEMILLDGIPAGYYHIGSRVIILPDRTILMSTGDVGSASYALDTNRLHGKFLRLNLDGSVPYDNPIPGSYVWSLGHRNAQGLVRAPNGIIYSSEHGPANDDEVNIIEKERNYGWPEVQGFCDLPDEQTYCTANNVMEPIAAWTPTLAVCGLDYYDHDTIVSLRLDVAEEYNTEDEIGICEGDSALVNGKYLSEEGVYVDTLFSMYGCDSIVSTEIIHFDSGSIGVEDSVMMALDDTVTLTANEGFISYKWNDDPPSQNNTIAV